MNLKDEYFALSCPYFPPKYMGTVGSERYTQIMAWRGAIDNYQTAMARAVSGNPWAYARDQILAGAQTGNSR